MAELVSLYADRWSAQIYDYHFGMLEEDLPFWLRLAKEQGGSVLELAVGTGRVALALARAGFAVTGVDCSEHMLEVARRKREREPRETGSRLRLVLADMCSYALADRCSLVIVPARAFQALLTREQQRNCLESSARHLLPGGRIALDLFQPLLSRLGAPGGIDEEETEFDGPEGTPIRCRAHTDYDLAAQTMTGRWQYEQMTPEGAHTREYLLRLRYCYRYEVEWMLEACGFTVEAAYGGFDRSPISAESKEMIFVARKGR